MRDTFVISRQNGIYPSTWLILLSEQSIGKKQKFQPSPKEKRMEYALCFCEAGRKEQGTVVGHVLKSLTKWSLPVVWAKENTLDLTQTVP